MAEFLDVLKEEFEKQLATKTNWGRNDVMLAFHSALIQTFAHFLPKELDK